MRTPHIKPVEEFKDQVLEIARVTRVTKGGKRMRFRTLVVIGNHKGKVGVGIAKGADVVESIAKAKSQAKKNVVDIKMHEKSIPHRVDAKYSAARIIIKPAVAGHGLMAGGSARVVLNMAGINDATAKYVSKTSNKLVNAMVAIEALKKLKSPKVKAKAEAPKPEPKKEVKK